MWALDTNTVIHCFKRSSRVSERLLATSPSCIAVPSMVVYEIEVGILKSDGPAKRSRQFEQLLKAVTVLPFTGGEAQKAARIRTELARQGTLFGPLNVLIAGAALIRGAMLVSHNTSEFSRVPGLILENWYD